MIELRLKFFLAHSNVGLFSVSFSSINQKQDKSTHTHTHKYHALIRACNWIHSMFHTDEKIRLPNIRSVYWHSYDWFYTTNVDRNMFTIKIKTFRSILFITLLGSSWICASQVTCLVWVTRFFRSHLSTKRCWILSQNESLSTNTNCYMWFLQ